MGNSCSVTKGFCDFETGPLARTGLLNNANGVCFRDLDLAGTQILLNTSSRNIRQLFWRGYRTWYLPLVGELFQNGIPLSRRGRRPVTP